MRHLLAILLTLAVVPVFAEESPMFEKMKTYCFGRYLVDIPVDAVLIGFGNKYRSVSIESKRSSQSALDQSIENQINALKMGSSAAGYYKFNREERLNKNSTLLLGYKVAFGDAMYRIDSFKFDRGYAFTTAGESYNDKKIDEIVGAFKSYLSNVRYRSDREIPSEPGFCFENGFVANDGKTSQPEHASLSFKLKNNPDVWVRISSYVYSKQETPLLQRIDDGDKKLEEKTKFVPGASELLAQLDSQSKKLKAAERTINNMSGQEVWNEYPSDDRTGIDHHFIWETLGEVGNPLKPGIHLDISTGRPVKGDPTHSSLTTKQVQTLYEAIVKTIRIRPTGGAAKVSQAPPQPTPAASTPLDTQLASGQTCPQSGTWRCDVPGAQNPERRILAGQTLPSVMISVERSLWQAMTGKPEQVAREARWTLVGIEQDESA